MKYRSGIIIFTIVVLFISTLLMVHPADAGYWLEFWWMFPVAFTIALTVNTLGISGAALFVPFFILVFPLFSEPLTAAQSVRVGLITESFGLTSSAIAFLGFGLVDKKLAIISALGAIPLVIAGALTTELVPQSILYLLIAVLLLIAVALVYYRRTLAKQMQDEISKTSIDYSVTEGERVKIQAQDNKVYQYCRTKEGYKKRFIGYGIGGVFQGAAGFGIGEIGIISTILSNIPTRIAIGTSHLVVASTAIVASVMHVSLSSVGTDAIPWNLILINVPAVVIAGQLAPHVAAKLKTEVLEKTLITLFSVIAFALIVLAFGFTKN